MALTPGTQLGPYQIAGLIGTGGMGEVYRAHDPRLGRDVAIKVAAEAFSERFTREARAIAALNHTNICHLYDVGPSYLVMEFVEGDNPKGPMAFDEVLPIARQMIDGIEAAHERGIIHRDLKPANIKVTPDGVVKILDFGLAKAMEPDGAGRDLTNSPTLAPTLGGTMQGSILGTAGYMAPEQAKGRQADRRSDIWAFGVVVCELVTGKKLFPGETTIEILADVINKEPDLSAVPPRLHKLLRWCLEKDRKDRLQAIGDARRLLADEAPMTAGPLPHPAPSRQIRVAWAAAAALAIGLAAVSWRHFRERPLDAPEVRTDIATPVTTDQTSFALSPDGRQLAFAASGDGTQRLWLRPLDKATARPLAGTEGGNFPFWSPDSRSIAFFADGKLKRLDLAGGAPQVLANAAPRGGAWNAGGLILFSQTTASPLLGVPSSGGVVTAVTKLGDHMGHRFPFFLPDGRRFLFYAVGTSSTAGIYLGSLDDPDLKRLTAADGTGVYLPGDWVLFVRGGSLLAQRLDLERRELTGDAVSMADPVVFDANTGATALTISSSGLIAYRIGGIARRQLTWFDRSGNALGTLGPADDSALTGARLSPDGRRVVVFRTVQGNTDIWIMDSDRATRFTFDAGLDRYPTWSPDGSRIAFDSNRNGIRALYQKPSNLSEDEKVVLNSAQDSVVQDWSPDGRFMSFLSFDPQSGSDIWMLPLQGDRKPFVFVKTGFDERRGMFSRDGHWVAYHSNESGRYEVYVRPFPGPGAQRQISTAGGLYPLWGYGDKELYYVAADGTLMASSVSIAGEALELGRPLTLFRTRIYGGGTEIAAGLNYDITRDGRFLINTVLDDAGATPITLIQNWKPPVQRP